MTDVATLAAVPIDDVLGTIDRGLTTLPTPSELYDRWERQHWTVGELDFTHDRAQWIASASGDALRASGPFIGFLHGEVAVTDTLAPYLGAMPRQDQRLFLTTQIVDEARHVAFFNRFFRDVLGYGSVEGEALLEQTHDQTGPAFQRIFEGGLQEMSRRIALEPDRREHVVEGVTLYHVLVEGTIAVSFQRSNLAAYRKRDFLPGYRAGFTAVARDESRHILFGVGFLRDALHEDPHQEATIQRTLVRWLPEVQEIFRITPDTVARLHAAGIDPQERFAFAHLSLQKKLKLLGLTEPADFADSWHL
jgi:ribonucleoside-diphosphate reductase beta chain